MSQEVGYENVKCEVGLPGCLKKGAGYGRYKKFAKVGPVLNACEKCARTPYEPPPQFQENKDEEIPEAF